MQEVPTTQHEGSTTQRLDRLEQKVDTLVVEVAALKQSGGDRRASDEARLRKLEDTQLIWDTRWQAIGTMLTRTFGTSIIAAVASVLAAVVAILAIANAVA